MFGSIWCKPRSLGEQRPPNKKNEIKNTKHIRRRARRLFPSGRGSSNPLRTRRHSVCLLCFPEILRLCKEKRILQLESSPGTPSSSVRAARDKACRPESGSRNMSAQLAGAEQGRHVLARHPAECLLRLPRAQRVHTGRRAPPRDHELCHRASGQRFNVNSAYTVV